MWMAHTLFRYVLPVSVLELDIRFSRFSLEDLDVVRAEGSIAAEQDICDNTEVTLTGDCIT